MIKNEYIWKNGSLIPWDNAHTHVLSHGLHYGSAVFEGIRFYKTARGPAIFKLQEHIERFFYSAQQLGMKIPFSIEEICQATIDTISENGDIEGYIRPLAYYGYGSMKVTPTPDLPIEVIIATWPWGDYLPAKEVDVVTSSFIRIHPKSTVADAKISGHYINSIIAGLALQNTHYHEALLLDSNGYVAEGCAANIFMVKDGKLITTPAGTILVGITRNTVLQIAQEFGIAVEERYFTPDEMYLADEAFFCGTAVEVTPIRSLDDHLIASGKIGLITAQFKQRYKEVVCGQATAFHSSLSWVEAKKEATV